MLANLQLTARRLSTRFSIMNIPGQIVLNDMIGDGVESVISFTDDEQSIQSLGAMDSRWEPEESMPPPTSNGSPKFPQRRGSVVANPAVSIDLPKIPRRRGTVLVRTGSNDSSHYSSKKAPKKSPPPIRRRNTPPRFPCRKRSQESVPINKRRDLVRECSRRSLTKQLSAQRVNQQSFRKTGAPNQKMATAA